MSILIKKFIKDTRIGGKCLQGPGAKKIWDFNKNQFDSIMMHSYLEHEVEIISILDGIAALDQMVKYLFGCQISILLIEKFQKINGQD